MIRLTKATIGGQMALGFAVVVWWANGVMWGVMWGTGIWLWWPLAVASLGLAGLGTGALLRGAASR